LQQINNLEETPDNQSRRRNWLPGGNSRNLGKRAMRDMLD